MDKKEYYNNCESCGRPMVYAPEKKCNYCNCCIGEYHHKMNACIRNKKPDCMAKAVIPSVTVETLDGITNLANCFVHVTANNTTYYIDDKHRPMLVWSGDVEVELPSTVVTSAEYKEFVQSFKLRSQRLLVKSYDQDMNRDVITVFYFDKTGKIYGAGEYVEMVEEV